MKNDYIPLSSLPRARRHEAVEPASVVSRTEPAPLLYSKKDAARTLGIGITKLRELVLAGKLKPVHIGDRFLIPASELERYVADLVAAA
jgi:excisionase family DNA binding protein